jgi:hypothetical protein
MKLYVEGLKEHSQAGPDNVNVWYTSNRQRACGFLRQQAEAQRSIFEGQRFRDPTAPTGSYRVCTGFRVEEREDGTFVIFWEPP